MLSSQNGTHDRGVASAMLHVKQAVCGSPAVAVCTLSPDPPVSAQTSAALRTSLRV